MPTVFLSYSTKDHYFAELAAIKLEESGVQLWRDRGQLRAGSDWRGGIERGISESIAALVALSQRSAESSYVTFEWAYGLGKGKTVVPLKLENCKIHPRLEPIQHLISRCQGLCHGICSWNGFAKSRARPLLREDLLAAAAAPQPEPQDPTVKAILAYLSQRGYQMVSYERLRKRIDTTLSDDKLDVFVQANSSIFRRVTLKDGRRGLAKLVP